MRLLSTAKIINQSVSGALIKSNPKLEVNNRKGAGAVIIATFLGGNNDGNLIAEPSACIGFSGSVFKKIQIRNNPIDVTATGQSLFYHKFSPSNLTDGNNGGCWGTVVLSPKHVNSDVFVIHLDGSSDWLVRRKAFIASNSSESMVSGILIPGGVVNSNILLPEPAIEITGFGDIALSSIGGGSIDKVTLAPGEIYHLKKNHLLAWEANHLILESFSADDFGLAKTPQSHHQPFYIRWLSNIYDHLGSRLYEAIKSSQNPFLTIKGPGTFYFCSNRPQNNRIEILSDSPSSPSSLEEGASTSRLLLYRSGLLLSSSWRWIRKQLSIYLKTPNKFP